MKVQESWGLPASKESNKILWTRQYLTGPWRTERTSHGSARGGEKRGRGEGNQEGNKRRRTVGLGTELGGKTRVKMRSTRCPESLHVSNLEHFMFLCLRDLTFDVLQSSFPHQNSNTAYVEVFHSKSVL